MPIIKLIIAITNDRMPITKVIMPIIKLLIAIIKFGPVAFRLRKASIWFLFPSEKR